MDVYIQAIHTLSELKHIALLQQI